MLGEVPFSMFRVDSELGLTLHFRTTNHAKHETYQHFFILASHIRIPQLHQHRIVRVFDFLQLCRTVHPSNLSNIHNQLVGSLNEKPLNHTLHIQ